jgi:hypothetical protein
MKKFLTLCFFAASIILNAQTLSDTLVKILKSKNLEEVKGFFTKPAKSLDTDKILDRQIVDNYFEYSYGIRNVPGYKICILSNGNKIIYSKLIAGGKNKHEEKDAAGMKEFTKAYEAFFQSKVKVTDFFTDSVYYGSRCGFTAMDPPMRKKLTALVDAGNSKELHKWLQSPLTEKQLYAVDGFISLEKKGYAPTDLEKKLIAFIKTKKGEARVCGATEHSNKEIAKIFAGKE